MSSENDKPKDDHSEGTSINAERYDDNMPTGLHDKNDRNDIGSQNDKPKDEHCKGTSNNAEGSDDKMPPHWHYEDDRKDIGSRNDKPKDEHCKGTSNNAEGSDDKTPPHWHYEDDRKDIGSQNDKPKDEHCKGTSNNAEGSDDNTPPHWHYEDDRKQEDKVAHAEEQAVRYNNLIQALRKFGQDIQLENDQKEDKYEKRTTMQKVKTEDYVQFDNDMFFAKALSSYDWLRQEIRTLQGKLSLAEEQEVKYKKLVDNVRKFGQNLELQDHLGDEKSEKEKRVKKQKNKAGSDIQLDNDILANAMSRFQSLVKKTRETERMKEDLKTDLAKSKENHRKMSEKWKADEKNLQQNIKHKEQTIKEGDKCIKSLNEKLQKTVAEKESLLKDKEQVNRDLFQKQLQLQQEMQVNNEKNQEVVQELDQHIQRQYWKLQQKDTAVNVLTKALQESEKERNNLTLRLSKMAGACLTRENPNIADLSDRNRPTKLAERYSELYDNEWTDAFEELCEQKHIEEVQCIKALLDLLKVTNDECVRLTKPNREILRTLTSVSVTLNSDSVHKKQSAGTGDHSLATSINPSIAIRRGENTKDNSTTEPSEQSQEEDMDVDMIDDGTHLENSQATGGMNPFESHESSKGTECDPNEGKGPDEKQAGNGQPNNMQKMDEDSAHLENSPATGGMNPLESYEFVAETDCDPNEGKGPDEKQVVNGQPNDMQESDKRTESESNEGHSQDEKQSDNGQMSNVQEIEDNAKNIPEGFSSNVDTGEISAELVIDISEEDTKAVSDIRRLSSVRLETEKRISKLVAAKIAFERSIDTKRLVKVMAFITKCAELCWYMAIQEPPVVIEFHEPVVDELFEKDKYKAYTEMGEKLDYVVWPPLFLCSGGGTLCKGTAQGKK